MFRTYLTHKTWDYTMKGASFEVPHLARSWKSLLPCTKTSARKQSNLRNSHQFSEYITFPSSHCKKKWEIILLQWVSFGAAAHLKFSAVLGTISARSSISILPFGDPPIVTSKNTTGFSIISSVSCFLSSSSYNVYLDNSIRHETMSYNIGCVVIRMMSRSFVICVFSILWTILF